MRKKNEKKKKKIQKMFLRRCSPAGHSSMIFSPMNSDESIVYACPCEPLNTRCVMSRSAGSWCCNGAVVLYFVTSHGILAFRLRRHRAVQLRAAALQQRFGAARGRRIGRTRGFRSRSMPVLSTSTRRHVDTLNILNRV